MSEEEFNKKVIIPQAILNIIRENLNRLSTGQTRQERARIHSILAQTRPAPQGVVQFRIL